MKVLVVLPPENLEKEQAVRMVTLAGRIPPGCDSMTVAAGRAHLEHFRAVLPSLEVSDLEGVDAGTFDAVVSVDGVEQGAPRPGAGPKAREYRIDSHGRIGLVGRPLDETEYPHLKKHVFNRLSSGLNSAFYYFPYGYLFRDTAVGPVNEFGHRVGTDLSGLGRREGDHRLVVVLGGSAAFSMYSHHDEMFAARLEVKLNEQCAAAGRGGKYTVLNFAQHGSVLLNEMITYLLFCQPLRPDIVITHDGFNDFVYGQISDPHLLNTHAITYQKNLEEWSRILHPGDDEGAQGSGEPYEVVNFPRAIVRSYGERQVQFRQMVQAGGGELLAGLQPFLHSKSALSEREIRWNRSISGGGSFEEAYRKVPFLYEKYLDLRPSLDIGHTVDLHGEFGRFDEGDTVFGDFVHTVPAGDEAIAGSYCRAIAEKIDPGLRKGEG